MAPDDTQGHRRRHISDLGDIHPVGRSINSDWFVKLFYNGCL